jgi:hypothetical protein
LSLPCTVPSLHVRSGHVSRCIAPSELKQPWTFALAASCHSGHLARAAASPGPRCSRRAALLASPNLRRRGMTARTFGTEGQRRSDGLLLHDKTHITQVTLAFPSNQHCESSPVWPKLRVSRNRQPGRTWTGLLRLPKAIFPNSSPSSVRAVLSSRWAELTTNSSQGEKRASELPRTARADADPSKMTRAALREFYRCERLSSG